MGFGLSHPDFFLQEDQGTQQRQATSRASCGLPQWGCATETLTAPCSLGHHWEPAGRWCCHDENESVSGEGLRKSWCRCRCRPKPLAGSLLLRGRWAPSQPGHHWSLHPLPFRTIYRCRCGPRWTPCWIVCYCWSVQSMGRLIADANRK